MKPETDILKEFPGCRDLEDLIQLAHASVFHRPMTKGEAHKDAECYRANKFLPWFVHHYLKQVGV